MTTPGWPEIAARLHRTLAACDRDTDLELAAGPRRLRLAVRRDTVQGHCPGYDERRLADLGWRPGGDGGGWWYATPRTAEGLHWWSDFAARTAAAVLTADPAALSCRVLPPATDADPAGAPVGPRTDVTGPDAAATDVTATGTGSDAKSREFTVPDAETSDRTEPDGEAAQVTAPDGRTTQVTVPGGEATDVTVPGAGATVRDAAGTDLTVPDAAGTDLTVPGAAGTDLTVPGAEVVEPDGGTGGRYAAAPAVPADNPLPEPTGGRGGAGRPGADPAATSAPTGADGPAGADAGTDVTRTGSGAASPWDEAAPHRRASGRHRAQEQVEVPRPRSPEPELADVLARAAARHDLPDYLGALAAGPVCVPLAGEPSPDRDFPWTVVLGAGRAPLLPVFTSPEILAAFAGDGVPFVALSAAELLADWPDPGWGLAVDPGAPHGLTLTAPALAALLAANEATGPGSRDDGSPVPVPVEGRDAGGR